MNNIFVNRFPINDHLYDRICNYDYLFDFLIKKEKPKTDLKLLHLFSHIGIRFRREKSPSKYLKRKRFIQNHYGITDMIAFIQLIGIKYHLTLFECKFLYSMIQDNIKDIESGKQMVYNIDKCDKFNQKLYLMIKNRVFDYDEFFQLYKRIKNYLYLLQNEKKNVMNFIKVFNKLNNKLNIIWGYYIEDLYERHLFNRRNNNKNNISITKFMKTLNIFYNINTKSIEKFKNFYDNKYCKNYLKEIKNTNDKIKNRSKLRIKKTPEDKKRIKKDDFLYNYESLLNTKIQQKSTKLLFLQQKSKPFKKHFEKIPNKSYPKCFDKIHNKKIPNKSYTKKHKMYYKKMNLLILNINKS